jgi:choline dehydrogenase
LTRESRYDYVIVGAGSAGCALARRLSDIPEVSICLLEAGGRDDRPEIHDPEVYFSLWGSEVDWGYRTVPQRHTANRVHLWPRGKVLGGTSSLNGMVYLRGAAADYDVWAYLGNVGWDWASVRRSFEEMEELLQPSVLAEHNDLSYVFIDASLEAGHAYNEHFNSGVLEGVGWNESTIYQRRRQSAAAAFVAPVIDRSNLTVVTDAHVHRLVVERDRVVGVQYLQGGRSETVAAAEEVILCAGAVDSPKLLLSSGVGPAGELDELGIEVIHDLPGVGRNLVDHMLIGVVYAARKPVPPFLAAITECCVFARSDPRRLNPDVEISFAKQALFAEGAPVPEHCYTIIPGIVRPQSRGSVRLRSDSPLDPPLINPRHLAEPADVQGLIEGIELSRRIGEAGAFAEWSDGEIVPGPDSDLEQFVRAVAGTWFHPVGTCKMGSGGDAVVDTELRVRGLEGLRIADASIMPEIVSANTNGASMMIGWHAAGIILS